MGEVYAFLDRYDLNKDGVIEPEELKNMIRKAMGGECPSP